MSSHPGAEGEGADVLGITGRGRGIDSREGAGQYLGWEVSALPGASWARGSGAGAAVPAGGVTPSPRGMVTSWASDASSPQWGQKTIPFSWDTQALWKRWATRKSGWHSRKVPWGRETMWLGYGSPFF